MLKGLPAGGIALGIAAVFPDTLLFPFLAVVLGLVMGVFPGSPSPLTWSSRALSSTYG